MKKKKHVKEKKKCLSTENDIKFKEIPKTGKEMKNKKKNRMNEEFYTQHTI